MFDPKCFRVDTLPEGEYRDNLDHKYFSVLRISEAEALGCSQKNLIINVFKVYICGGLKQNPMDP